MSRLGLGRKQKQIPFLQNSYEDDLCVDVDNFTLGNWYFNSSLTANMDNNNETDLQLNHSQVDLVCC